MGVTSWQRSGGGGGGHTPRAPSTNSAEGRPQSNSGRLSQFSQGSGYSGRSGGKHSHREPTEDERFAHRMMEQALLM